MSNRFANPNPQFLDATPDVLNGGFLYFYVTTTSTLATTYNNQDLDPGHANANPVPLDSAGRAATEIWLDPDVTYKVVLKDADGNTIWTRDPVADLAAATPASFLAYNGDPNGHVKGTQGVVNVSKASVVWDYSNAVLWICTTTGDAASAVWTQLGSNLTGVVAMTGVISPTSLSADQNNYSPTGIATASIIRQTSSVDVAITGLAGGATGRLITYVNISAFKHTFKDQRSSSTAANRFALDGDYTVWPGQTVQFLYDATSARWRVWGATYNMPVGDPGGRLTLTTATPVLTTDTTAKTQVIYTQYKHNLVPIYNGSAWAMVPFSELSQGLAVSSTSPAAAAINSVYDMFVWNDSGTLRCTRGPAWSSATSRGTGAGTSELTRVDGRWVNANAITNGPAANRGTYVGTIATDGNGANGQLNMQFQPAAASAGNAPRLDVWNMYNRLRTYSLERDGDNSWNYSTATWRPSNNSSNTRITFVVGQDEDGIDVFYSQMVSMSGGTANARSGIGLDSTTAPSGIFSSLDQQTGLAQIPIITTYRGLTGIGSHYVQALEYGGAATVSWLGDNGSPSTQQSGLYASLMM